MKKKMDTLTKAKLLYSGELLLFAIAFAVLAILEFVKVLKIGAKHPAVFNWITIFGGSWIIADFLWALFSKKRRKKICLLDKIIHLPAGLAIVSFDIYCFIAQPDFSLYQTFIPCFFTYFFLCYTFEAIYHWFYPVPNLVDASEEVDKQIAEEEAKLASEEEQPKAEEEEPKEEEKL